MSRISEEINDLLDALATLAGAGVVWKDKNGLKGIPCLKDEHFYHCNPFCERVKKSPGKIKTCSSRIKDVAKFRKKGPFEPFFHTCHAGCMELIVPIAVNGELESMLFIGPFTTEISSCSYSVVTCEFDKLPILDKEKMTATGVVIKSLIGTLQTSKAQYEQQMQQNKISHPRILLAVEFIQKQLSTPITADMVADKINLSASRFIHLFKEETGECFSTYLTFQRIEMAKRLLTETSMKIFEVANRCGYSEQCYFGAVFKKYAGYSPGQYRKQFGSTFGV